MYRKTVNAALTATLLTTGAIALAHSGATGIVKERMDLMGVIGDANKELTEMMRGKRDYDAARVRELAGTIAGHGGDAMTRLFPEDSIMGPSEALPAIWSDWENFEALAEQLAAYAKALEQAADNPRAHGGAAGGMMSGGTLMQSGGGMMSGSTSMQSGAGMMSSGGGMMGAGMMTGAAGPDPEMLAQMPPDAAFMHMAQTCASCHEGFRKKKE